MDYHYCRTCDREMRPAASTLIEWPGTVLHSGYGYCYNCRKRAKKGLAAKRPEPPAEVEPRELDPDELIVQRMIQRRGLPDEFGAMLGFNDPTRGEALSPIQSMKNSLTSSVGTGGEFWGESVNDLRNVAVRQGLKGRRL